MMFAVIVFWLSVGLIVWTYLGFPFALALRALGSRQTRVVDGPLPRVSYLIVLHNERSVIDDKLANVEAMDYPRELLQVIFASDGSDDGTNEAIRAHAGPTPLELLELPRVGKNAALNAGVAQARGEILVFSDADSMLERGALRALVAPFGAGEVGCVGGDYRYANQAGEGQGERAYWSIDREWKRLESLGGNMTSATGQIYAIRRTLVEPVPDGVTDDFFVSTGAVVAGQRLVFAPEARASGPVADSNAAEFRRKVRMMGRGFASLWARRELFSVRRHGWYAIQLFSHKVLRRLVVVPVIALAFATWPLVGQAPVYAWAAAAQLGIHGLALVGWLLRERAAGQLPVFTLPLFFAMTCIAGLIAAIRFALGRQSLGWEPYRPMTPPDPDRSKSGVAP